MNFSYPARVVACWYAVDFDFWTTLVSHPVVANYIFCTLPSHLTILVARLFLSFWTNLFWSTVRQSTVACCAAFSEPLTLFLQLARAVFTPSRCRQDQGELSELEQRRNMKVNWREMWRKYVTKSSQTQTQCRQWRALALECRRHVQRAARLRVSLRETAKVSCNSSYSNTRRI